MASGQAPGFFHILGVDADDRRDLTAGGGELHVAQHARPAAFADPVRGEPRFAGLCGDLDIAAKADGVVKAEAFQKLEQLDVAETSVGQDRYGDAVGQTRFQAGKAEVFEIVARVLEFVLADRQPQERRRASMAGDEMQGQCGLVVGIEVGPIHRHNDGLALADGVANPGREQIPNAHALLLKEAIDLLDGVLVGEPARLRQRMADHGDGQRCAGHHPERGVRQRQHPLGVNAFVQHVRQIIFDEGDMIYTEIHVNCLHKCDSQLIKS